jgi:hypothetical protein
MPNARVWNGAFLSEMPIEGDNFYGRVPSANAVADIDEYVCVAVGKSTRQSTRAHADESARMMMRRTA